MKLHLWPMAALSTFVLVFCALLVIVPASCGSGIDCKDPKNAATATCIAQGAGSAAIDCGGGSIDGAIALWGPEIEKLIESARQPDGSINWPAIESDLVQDIFKYGSCVVGAVFAQYFDPIPTVASGSGSAGSALAVPHVASATDRAAAAAAYQRVMKAAVGGRKLQFQGGQVR